MSGRFRDRADAGTKLAEAVADALGPEPAPPVVLALPRGGVPVAAPVAARLGAPLEVLVVRKIGLPGHPEYGIGAIAEGGTPWLDPAARGRHRADPAAVAEVIEAERAELARRVTRYRGDRPLPSLGGRTVVLVDDGLATGVTARVALDAVRASRPAEVLLAVPVAAPSTAADLRARGVEVVSLLEPDPFVAVGRFYEDFSQTSDAEVAALLASSA